VKKQLWVAVGFSVSAVMALAGWAAPRGQNRATDADKPDRFIGAWRLASLESPGADGKVHKADSVGMFVFTRDGHAAVQVMERNPAPQAEAGADQYSRGGYEATFGTYEVDEAAHTFTFHVEGALARNLIGKDLLRTFEFSGKQLIVRSTHPDEHWKVVWERY
jgi:hypothetical protein